MRPSTFCFASGALASTWIFVIAPEATLPCSTFTTKRIAYRRRAPMTTWRPSLPSGGFTGLDMPSIMMKLQYEPVALSGTVSEYLTCMVAPAGTSN